MDAHFISRTQTGLFGEKQLLLSENQTELGSFIGLPFCSENFAQQIQSKQANLSDNQRDLLVKELQKKYDSIDNNSAVLNNIELLKKQNTFTITTGHQLSLLTGPLYFIYKIVHVIKLCKELKALYPENHFVPIYWMASEDHDFEEIKSMKIYGKTLTWEKEAKGAVGRLDTNDLDKVSEQFQSFFEAHPSSEIHALLGKLKGKSYGEAFFNFIHHLFAEHGLVIVDGDNRAFKKSFSNLIKKEIQEQFSFDAVTKTNAELEKKGFKIQVNPREINLFYLGQNSRERFIQTDQGFVAGNKHFSENELLSELETAPENFSPNVVLRPLYQEFILPNLCYVGGVGEISYWLQLKGVFDASNVPFPMIQVRTSALWLDQVSAKKWEQLAFSETQLFEPIHVLKKQYLQEHDEESVDFQLVDFQLDSLITEWQKKVNETDPSLASWVTAEWIRISKQTDAMKQKLEKAVKSKHEKALKSIEQVKEKLFPDGGLQERSVNFFQFCPDGNYKQKLHDLVEIMQPFSSQFLVIKEEY